MNHIQIKNFFQSKIKFSLLECVLKISVFISLRNSVLKFKYDLWSLSRSRTFYKECTYLHIIRNVFQKCSLEPQK